jgi:AraC-like DNA-binding protein
MEAGIARACALLEQGRTITAAMLESGFNTKSNFNREFLRLKEISPSAWIARQPGAVLEISPNPLLPNAP